MSEKTDVQACPLCNKPNSCGQAVGLEHDLCWCAAESFPREIFKLVPRELINKACICKQCLDEFKQFGKIHTNR